MADQYIFSFNKIILKMDTQNLNVMPFFMMEKNEKNVI
jgi:hypothetical protein